MSAPSPSDYTPESARHLWRYSLLWTAFVLALLGGLILAVLYGGTAPVLLKVVGS